MIQATPKLTTRELQILGLVALGYSAKEVAMKCGIGHRTVEVHLDTARLKLRARNRTHVVAIAIMLGMLSKTDLQLEPDSPLAA